MYMYFAPTVIFLIFLHNYVCFCFKGSFNTPKKHLHPLTQKSWFIKDTQLKVLHRFLKKCAIGTVNTVNLARHMNVSIQLIENLHHHVGGRYAWKASTTSDYL